ncbi:Uncharacterised protein [Vibrio cholerae]|nr:Uncharacterised protein [Vibrio cholerae]
MFTFDQNRLWVVVAFTEVSEVFTLLRNRYRSQNIDAFIL